MAQIFNGQAFDAAQVDPTSKFDAIPAGEYPVMITASELKLTKDGTGQYLQLELQVQDGAFQGRKLFDRLNLHNANQKAVEIAQRQLSQLCHAVGVMQVTDSEQLHFKPCIAKIGVRTEPGRDPSNEIKGYKAAAGVPVSQTPKVPTAPMPQASAPAAPAAPWMAKKVA